MTFFSDANIAGVFLTAVASLVAAVISLVMGVVNWRHSRKIHYSETEKFVEGLYDKLIDYRLANPEVLALSRLWTPDCVAKIYRQSTEEERRWAIYYGYIELCIGYCNATLHSWKRGNLDKMSYEVQYEPLIKLLISEHFPVINQLSRESKYVSDSISNYIKSQRSKGWEWEKEYANIIVATPSGPNQTG